jgi:hypothetical protein
MSIIGVASLFYLWSFSFLPYLLLSKPALLFSMIGVESFDTIIEEPNGIYFWFLYALITLVDFDSVL